MQALMSFDKAPPLAAPLRFFLTAPLFSLVAGLLLLALGPDMFASRWMPGLLAATHLITVGFMLQVMLGALIQILPVVAGANLRHPLVVARWLHVGLSAGALLLAGCSTPSSRIKKNPALFNSLPLLKYTGVYLDVGNLMYRSLNDRDTTCLKNRQGNGEDRRTDEYLTEAGLEVRFPESHMIIENMRTITAS